MQEIIGAKPVRDTSFKARKAFLAMRSIGIGDLARCNTGCGLQITLAVEPAFK